MQISYNSPYLTYSSEEYVVLPEKFEKTKYCIDKKLVFWKYLSVSFYPDMKVSR